MNMLILEVDITAAVSRIDIKCETIVYLLLSARGSSIERGSLVLGDLC